MGDLRSSTEDAVRAFFRADPAFVGVSKARVVAQDRFDASVVAVLAVVKRVLRSVSLLAAWLVGERPGNKWHQRARLFLLELTFKLNMLMVERMERRLKLRVLLSRLQSDAVGSKEAF